MSDRDEFLHRLASELDAMERQFDEIEADLRADLPQDAEQLQDKLRNAKARKFELSEAGEQEWEQRREKAESAWHDLKQAFSQVRSRLGD